MLTLIKKAQENIEAFFDTLETNLFLKKDVRNILSVGDNREGAKSNKGGSLTTDVRMQ